MGRDVHAWSGGCTPPPTGYRGVLFPSLSPVPKRGVGSGSWTPRIGMPYVIYLSYRLCYSRGMSKTIQVRIPDATHELITREARARGITLSAYVRAVLLGATQAQKALLDTVEARLAQVEKVLALVVSTLRI